MIFDNVYTYLVCGALVVVFMSVYMGVKLKFYDKYAWWDKLIHFLSGLLFVSFGVAISKEINGLNKMHILIFSSTLSITLHVFWEVGEYIIDCVMHTDNQRWQKRNASVNHVSPDAIQPAGLVDTMNDTLFCMFGTLSACAVWWIMLAG